MKILRCVGLAAVLIAGACSSGVTLEQAPVSGDATTTTAEAVETTVPPTEAPTTQGVDDQTLVESIVTPAEATPPGYDYAVEPDLVADTDDICDGVPAVDGPARTAGVDASIEGSHLFEASATSYATADDARANFAPGFEKIQACDGLPIINGETGEVGSFDLVELTEIDIDGADEASRIEITLNIPDGSLTYFNVVALTDRFVLSVEGTEINYSTDLLTNMVAEATGMEALAPRSPEGTAQFTPLVTEDADLVESAILTEQDAPDGYEFSIDSERPGQICDVEPSSRPESTAFAGFRFRGAGTVNGSAAAYTTDEDASAAVQSFVEDQTACSGVNRSDGADTATFSLVSQTDLDLVNVDEAIDLTMALDANGIRVESHLIYARVGRVMIFSFAGTEASAVSVIEIAAARLTGQPEPDFVPTGAPVFLDENFAATSGAGLLYVLLDATDDLDQPAADLLFAADEADIDNAANELCAAARQTTPEDQAFIDAITLVPGTSELGDDSLSSIGGYLLAAYCPDTLE